MAYDIKNLLQYHPSPFRRNYSMPNHIICDIDGTYLETHTSSLFDLAKIALEGPEDKKTIPGASEYLEALLWSEKKQNNPEEPLVSLPKKLHFVSASPPQLRKTLEEKFLLDRVFWSSITFKNQLYNIKKVKFNLLREQISYKTLAILNIINKNPSSSFFLIGDNSESDPYIYTGIKLLKDGIISHQAYIDFLKIAQLKKSSIRTIAQAKGFLKPAKIKAIFIREVKTEKPSSLDPYLLRFNSYKSLLLHSYVSGHLGKEAFTRAASKLGALPKTLPAVTTTEMDKKKVAPSREQQETAFLKQAKEWFLNNQKS